MRFGFNGLKAKDVDKVRIVTKFLWFPKKLSLSENMPYMSPKQTRWLERATIYQTVERCCNIYEVWYEWVDVCWKD